MSTLRKLRIEVFDETPRENEHPVWQTAAEVVVVLPAGMEIPGERLIEATRLAYRHLMGDDLPKL